jgi:hypothetical protein
VSVGQTFWGSRLISSVPIGDLYVQCVISCGNRVIGSPHTRTQAVGPTVDKRKKPNGEKPNPSFVFEEDLDTNARVLELPRKARLVFEVRSLRSKTTAAQRVLGSTVAFGVLPLFGIRGRLVTGARELCLWPVGLSNPSMPERGEWLIPKRAAALPASQNLHHCNPVVLVVHINQPLMPEAGAKLTPILLLVNSDLTAAFSSLGASATCVPGRSTSFPLEGVAGTDPIYHADVFRKVQLQFTQRVSFVPDHPRPLDTTVGDAAAS